MLHVLKILYFGAAALVCLVIIWPVDTTTYILPIGSFVCLGMTYMDGSLLKDLLGFEFPLEILAYAAPLGLIGASIGLS